ncbi:MAG: methylmalonyl Co-A mutase-associated GTPase MeaB [Actinomycetia bacterium]|nr:methylmalonyl Co-A mutase-associated GTPase MeaB [Actinomycetes bacterium]
MTTDWLQEALFEPGGKAAVPPRRLWGRILSIAEADAAALPRLLEWAQERVRCALLIGVTGAPGAGKSTLIGKLARQMDSSGHRVGVLAIDPSSDRTGGAVLGDRLRMEAGGGDDIFFRSMATRGGRGGLARATVICAQVLAGFGLDRIIIETTGTGQTDTAIAAVSDPVLLVTEPGQGDEIQAMKAGVMERADVIVVNKADLPSTDHFCAALDLAMSARASEVPQILRTTSTSGEGIAELAGWIARRPVGPRSGFTSLSPEAATDYLTELFRVRLRDGFDRTSDDAGSDPFDIVALTTRIDAVIDSRVIGRLTDLDLLEKEVT